MNARLSLAFVLPALILLAPRAVAQRDSAFMEAFRQAMKINSMDEMERLVRQEQDQAVLAVIETCEEISGRSNDKLEEEVAALDKAWRAAFDTQFVQMQYEYFSFLGGEYKRSRITLKRRYDLQVAEYTNAREAKDVGKFPALGMDFLGMIDAFDDLGDTYYASMSAIYYADCFDDGLMGDDADYTRACEGYGKVCELREKLGLKDAFYNRSKERFDHLEFEGYGDPSKGPDARKAARAEADVSFAPIPLEATFELVSEMEGIVRPNYGSDEIFQIWTYIYLEGNGSTGTITSLEESPAIIREGAVKAKIDADGDGEGDIEIPLTGNITPVQVTLGHGDLQREWAFLATIGRQDDQFHGFRYNLAPDENQMQIYIAPAGSVVGSIGETRIQVIDDNLDGKYGSLPYSVGRWGMREGDFQFDVDTILVGESKRAVPWSSLVKVGEDWYQFGVDEMGGIVVQKDEIETGTLKLDFKGPRVDYLIVRGTSKIETVYIDLIPGAKKGTEVPAGTYELFAGRVSKGKRDQTMKALVLPTKNTPRWAVSAGGDATVKLGGPFGFDFSFEQDAETVTLNGKSVVVTGRSNETYQRPWNCASQVEASVRKAGTKKGGKGEKLRPAGSQEEIIDLNNDAQAAWFPMIGEPLKKKKAGEDAEVQLIEKKNKLFGKIESDWKGE